jgi:hypothetical protein
MPSPGLARGWMRENEVAARPVRALYECSGRHWPPSLVRTILLATSDADANRASGDPGIERVRRGCRCVHLVRAPRATLPTWTQVRWPQSAWPSRHAVLKCAVAAREARRRRDLPAAAPAARFSLTCAFVVCRRRSLPRLPLVSVCLSCVACCLPRVMVTTVVSCPLHVACCMLHVVRCMWSI